MKQRNVSIDIVRFILSLFVMFAHVGFELDDTIMGISPLVEILLGRWMVLFFFMVSGYYYISARLQGKDIFRKQIAGFLKVYLFWTCVYYLMSFVLNVIIEKEPLKGFLLERVKFFFGEGSYPHLWYMVALIYAVIIVEIIFRLGGENGLKILLVLSALFYLIGILHSEYGFDAIGVPLLGDFYAWKGYEVFRNIFCLGLPSVMFGYVVIKIKERLLNHPRSLAAGFWVSMILMAVEGFLVDVYVENPCYKGMFFIPMQNILLLMLLLKYPMQQYEKYGDFCKRMYSYVYFSHPAFIAVTGVLMGILGISLPHIVLYIIITVIVLGSGVILKRIGGSWTKIII